MLSLFPHIDNLQHTHGNILVKFDVQMYNAQEPMKMGSTAELLFSIFDVIYVCVDQCIYVNKSLNKISSSHKAIITLQRIWIKLFKSYELLLQ